ncbi:CBS domain-containing protein [Amycolatopsis alkalitolerans]|uniref:CBS domain-containing protein n=2 Tax=Amycolatopsis alkalitolerans TaxID=2547244 RepID=A0A5C4LPF8_9PSEU|nr:CBS domain-containing protein [Amycolatopsis alkalitolerans]
MTRELAVVSPETEFKDIATLLATRRISAVPVVDGAGSLVGVVSEADLLPKEEHAGDPDGPSWFAGRRPRRDWHKAAALRAADLMTSPVRTADVTDPLSVVARQLVASRMRRLFVLDEGKLVGVVARRDLLGVFLRPDAEIKAEVETSVFERALIANPASYTVTVDRGEVTLLGRLERRSSVAAAGQLAALVPGVIEVRNRLDYVWDDERK